CDGTARIWQAASGKQIKSWPVAKACSDPALAASPCPLVWEPMAGRLLAMPVDCELRLLASAWSIAWSDAPLREASLRQAAPYFALRSPGLCPVNQLCWWWRSPQAGA
uniref:WD_REPEATS_REGION domain-containing protein n=1 Tax=Macrostomum lignano TaxID=282301 RepID=A0A1I8IDY9_9PLAT